MLLGEVEEKLVKEYQQIFTGVSNAVKSRPLIRLDSVFKLASEFSVKRMMFRVKCITDGIQPRHLADIEHEACRRLGLYSKFPDISNGT